MKNLIFILLFLFSCAEYYKQEITIPESFEFQCEVIIKNHLGTEVKRMSGDCNTLGAHRGFNLQTIISIGEKRK